MLHNTNDLKGYPIHATDGDIGRVSDCFFDDEFWTERYLVVETGSWLLNRKVLISPVSIVHPKWREASEKKTIPLSIAKKQVEDSPDIDTDMPVSRQHESRYLGFYAYPSYWGGTGLWGDAAFPGMMMPAFGALESRPITLSREVDVDLALAEDRLHQRDDIHLRSCKEVKGYHIHATDGEIGHVAGFLVEDETWAIRYIVIATSNWWLGHHVVISPTWIDEIRWLDRKASVKVSRQAVRDAAPYDLTVEFSRSHEIAVYKQYGFAGYWQAEPATESHMALDPEL